MPMLAYRCGCLCGHIDVDAYVGIDVDTDVQIDVDADVG